MTYIGFEDYAMQDLGAILDVMVKDRGYTLEPDAREMAMDMLADEKKRAGSKDFGNGRTVRNLVEKAEKELAMRLESEDKLSKGHGLSDDELKKALTTLTLKDIQKVSLDALGSKKAPSKGIDFGSAAAKVPANDSKAEAPVAPISKKPLSRSFQP
jgi:hypothetical protein